MLRGSYDLVGQIEVESFSKPWCLKPTLDYNCAEAQQQGVCGVV